MVVFTSCGNDPKEKIQSNLEEVVIEKGMGFVKKCNTISMDIDTITISDLKTFVSKTFPNGVPNDYEDEDFEKFISPIKSNNNDGSIAYLSVTHKYKIFMVGDPFKRDEVVVTEHRLVNPTTYEYISDDLSKDEMWLTPLQYSANKAMQEAFNAMEEAFDY
jgi:hypothetical protein